jgi:plasmid stabilization system protein ParE
MATRRFKVEISPTAERDIEEIIDYIARDSIIDALRWYELAKDAIATLAEMPERCPIAVENEAVDQKIRHLVFGNYRALFTIATESVQVLHVRNAAMERTL